MKNWCLDIGATPRTFDQCRLGHPACPKSTTIADKLGMTALDDKWCECYGRSRKRGGITPEELGRYGKGLMHLLADKIADPTSPGMSNHQPPTRHKILDLGEWSERKTDATDTGGTQHVSIEMVRLGFKMRPMRDGAGKPSPGTLAPTLRPRNPLNLRGEKIVKY